MLPHLLLGHRRRQLALGLRAADAHRLVQRARQGVGIHRLEQVAERAVLHRVERGRRGRRGRDEHEGDVQVTRADRPQQIDTGHLRHRQIAHDDVEGLPLEDLQGDLRRLRRLHVVAVGAEEPGIGAQDGQLVIDEEHASLLVLGRRRADGRKLRRRVSVVGSVHRDSLPTHYGLDARIIKPVRGT